MTTEALRVLCAPTCRRWGVEPVSEDGWLATVFEHLQRYPVAVTAPVESTGITSPPGLQMVTVGGRQHELLGSATRLVGTAIAVARHRLLRNADVVHIGLPLAVARTQSLVTAMDRDAPRGGPGLPSIPTRLRERGSTRTDRRSPTSAPCSTSLLPSGVTRDG